MIKHIRPHKVFLLCNEKSFSERVMRLNIPGLWEPHLLKTSLLIALAKFTQPKSFFEFGTAVGVTSLHIAMNLPPSLKVYTLDLDKDCFERATLCEKDIAVAKRYFKHRDEILFLGTPFEKQITRLYGDSTKFDFSPFEKKIGMLYIDGGHDKRTVMSDTQNAFKMLSCNRFSCIVWDDYNNPDYPEVTEYLHDVSQSRDIFHIEESTLCFYMNNAPGFFP